MSSPASSSSTDDSRPTAQRLLEIASTLFAERGYAGTSLAEIASRLGIRKPSLYNYYSSKEELFLEVFEHSLDAWRQASRPHLDGQGSCCQRLYRHLHSVVDFATGDPHAMALCRVAVVSQLEDDVKARVETLIRRQKADYRKRLKTFFLEALSKEEVVDVPAAVLIVSWETFLDGVVSARLLDLGSYQSLLDLGAEGLDEVWRLYWRGLSRHQEPGL